MSAICEQISSMIDMLPEQEQNLAYEFVKRLVLAWDPDFTKITPSEAAALEQAREEYERGEFVRLEDLKLG